MLSLAFPLLLCTLIVVVATTAHRRLPPALAARFVTIALVVVLVAALPTVLIVAVSFLAHAPVVGIGFQWCAQAIGMHGSVSPWIGVPVLVLLAAGVVRVARVLADQRRFRADELQPVHVVASERPYAVTLPGKAGQIVLSTAMLELLDDDEHRVVLAHERAHARHRHDRYLLTAELVAAVLPPLRTLTRRVNYSIERWADEAAAATCGDRRLVAMTLGKVALQTHPRTVASFGGLGVASRMVALMAPPVSRPQRPRLAALWATLGVAAMFSAYQLHHLERLVAALCPH
jgi:beta-lactamase regulating signal transducer with metallopeptidase domain